MIGVFFGVVILLAALLGWWILRHLRASAETKRNGREKIEREREADRQAVLEAERSIVSGVGAYVRDGETGPHSGSVPELTTKVRAESPR